MLELAEEPLARADHSMSAVTMRGQTFSRCRSTDVQRVLRRARDAFP